MSDEAERTINLYDALFDGTDLRTVAATFDVVAGDALIDLGDGRKLVLSRDELQDLLDELPNALADHLRRPNAHALLWPPLPAALPGDTGAAVR